MVIQNQVAAELYPSVFFIFKKKKINLIKNYLIKKQIHNNKKYNKNYDESLNIIFNNT